MRMRQWMGVIVGFTAAMCVGGCGECSLPGGTTAPPAADAVTADEIAAKARTAFAGDEALPECCAVPDQAQAIVQQADAASPPAETSVVAVASASPEPTTPPATEPGKARAGEWTAVEDRVRFDLGFTLTDQDGRAVTLSELRGKPMAVTFFFTRCPLPTMCPLIITTTARLQEQVAAAGLADKVQFVLISYDPKHDTPAVMKKYGEDRGIDFANAAMLVPRGEDLRHLINEFQIGVQYYTDGSIGHFIEMIVVDGEGRFVRDYTGEIWDNAAVLADLQRLVAEAP
jgi:cytochrome oxidase Cu insertion factor (SCO1/SenC/PrrC family)